MRKLVAALGLGLAVTAATVVPADARNAPSFDNPVDVVVATSGAPGAGFDRNLFDYDVLREALVAAELVDAVATTPDITVFAPNDLAFVLLARDLGYRGWNEAEAFATIAEATGFTAGDPTLLTNVLLYHVAPEGQTVRELRRAGDIDTLLEGSTVKVRGWVVVDADPDDRNALITFPRNVETGNGSVVQTVSRVLRPIDLP